MLVLCMAKDDRKGITPSDTDNKLGLSDPVEINTLEALGLAEAHTFALNEYALEADLDTPLILHLHQIAFGRLYHWAGQYRTTTPLVGQLTPPEPGVVPMQMYQLLDNTNFQIARAENVTDVVRVLATFHHEFVRIHPFANGNGRIARLLTNLIAYKLGYADIQLYAPIGEQRKRYIEALRQADANNFRPLEALIRENLKPLQ